jgi:hypothetical protein
LTLVLFLCTLYRARCCHVAQHRSSPMYWSSPPSYPPIGVFFFFFALVTGPTRCLSLALRDTRARCAFIL